MTEAVFYVDEQGFAFADCSAQQIEESLRSFIELLADPGISEFEISCWSQIWDVESASGKMLSSVLWEASDIDPVVRRLVGDLLDRATCWDESDESPEVPLDTICNDEKVTLSPSISLCGSQRSDGKTVGMVTTDQAGRQGSVSVSFREGSSTILSFLVDASDVVEFWRAEVEISDFSDVEVREISHLAFRSLCFADGVWTQFSRFSGEYRTVRRQFMKNLCALDDYLLPIRREFVEPHRVAIELRSAAGIDCSPESPLTRANRSAMSARDVWYEGELIRCEWHAKLEPHRNRIHFAVLEDCVLIGVFAEHLQT